MRAVKNEAELHKLGLALDPNDPKKAVPLSNSNGKAAKDKPAVSGANFSGVNDFNTVPPPDESWDADQLGKYAHTQNEQIIMGERKSAIHAYRLGQALICAKKKTEHGQWQGFLKKYGISPATWIRAKQLVERATDARLLKLGLTEAYIEFGILTQPEIPKDNAEGDHAKNNAAETSHKKKAVTKKPETAKQARRKRAAAKKSEDETADGKRLDPADKDEQEEEAYGEVGQDEDDEDFGCGKLFKEAAKRNGWDQQRQIQLLVDFRGQDIHDALLWDAHKEKMKDFLAEQEKLPPPKEPHSPLAVLVMLRNRLDYVVEDIKAVDWKKESSEDYHKLLDTIRQLVEQIGKGVPQ
jgi:hypothetical protein